MSLKGCRFELRRQEWSTERQLAYAEWCRMVVAGLCGTSTTLEELFGEAAEAAREAHQHAA